jgi:DNA repair protein RecO (recombination protein O)
MAFRETSQIVTLFTREKGKVSVIAKGARHPKSQFGATLQPMSHIQAIYYHKPTRDLQTLSETAHLTVFQRIRDNLDRIAIGLRTIEMVQALLQADEVNEPVFDLVLASLQHLNQAEGRLTNLWPFFQMRLAGMLGFQPAIERGEVEALPDGGGSLVLGSGAILPAGEPAPNARKASRTALRAFAILCRADLDAVLRMTMTDPVMHEVAGLIDSYLRYHLEDALPSRTHRVIGQLQDRRIAGF